MMMNNFAVIESQLLSCNVERPLELSLVSVVIPCYNHARYLSQAIESVLAQSYSQFEIIVVDDGSQDNTAEIAACYPEVVYIWQENQGLSAARNTGLRQSQGNYLVFLDADDLLLPGALEAGLNCLKAHPEYAFVSGHYRYVGEDGSVSREFSQQPIQEDHYLALLQDNYIGMHATVMYRRTALEAAGGFNTSLPACEDYDLYLRLSKRFSVGRHSEMVAEYRQHGANMSGNPELMLKTALTVLRSHGQDAKLDERSSQAYKTGIRYWQAHFGEQLLQQVVQQRLAGSYKQAFQGVLVLLQYAPNYLIGYIGWWIIAVSSNMLRPILPVSIRRWLVRREGLDYYPPVGHVDLGDLRRLTPLSQEFGYERGRPVDRYYIENFLADQAAHIHGRVLEVGDDAYTRQFGGDRVITRDVLHAFAGNPQATIVADLASADHIPANSFDCIILTQTLHLIYDVNSAIKTLYRILKPGGVLLATVPGISQISIDEWSERWYWAFTTLAIRRLFEETFPADHLNVNAYGNVLTATAFLNGLAVEDLRQEELDYSDPHYQLLITIKAVKTG